MMNDQAANLREKLNRQPDSPSAKTIAVVSGKGGVGKSNVAINFAIALRNAHKRVLLFDLDVGMGNIDILFGGQTRRTILDMWTKQSTIEQVVTKGPNETDYIAGGSSLTGIVTVNQQKMDYFLSQLQKLVPLYDYILFDMGAGISHDNLAFILAADECMVVTTPEPTAIMDAYGIMKHILNNQSVMPIYIVMNRTIRMKQGLTALFRLQHVVSHFLNVEIYRLGVLPEDSIVQTAVTRQIPFMLLNNRAAVSKAMNTMITRYLEESMEDWAQAPHQPFIQKIKQFLIERS